MPLRNRSLRPQARRLLVVLGLVSAGAMVALLGQSANAAPFAAEASVSPQVQYLGDATGTLFTFTIHNTGTTDSIGAVEIDRPGKTWTITACPLAPAGWSAQRSDTMCRYRSGSGTADDIAPGATSSDFQVRATSAAGTQDLPGTWAVKVSRSSNFDTPSKLKAAAAAPPGLGITAYSFQILDAVVDPATTTPGAACPAPNKSAITGSTGHTFVICGRNRTTGTLTPTAAQASLGGTFVASHGTFTSGPVAPTATSVILGTWSNVTITSTAGPGKTVIARVGSAANRTSPLTTLTGYEALNNPPNAVDDSRSTDEDSAISTDPRLNDTDPDGDPLQVTAVDTTSTSGSVTIGAGGTSVTYDPNGQFEYLAGGEIATDTFTYTVSDPYGASDTATVTITVFGVNDPPTAVDDTTTISEDSTGAGVDVLGNDTDPDGSDTLAVSLVDTTGTTGTVINNGSSVTYDPNGQFEGLAAGQTATDAFTYTVSDGNGGTDTATVTVTITGANDPPTAVDDSGAGFATDSATAFTTGDVLANDTDPDGDALGVSALDTTGTAGDITDNGDGTFGYDPAGAFDDLPRGDTDTDTFAYTVSDGNGGTDTGTVTITITGVNHDPVATDDIKTVGENSGSTSIDVLGNDTDADADTLNVTGVDTTGTTGTVTNNGTDVSYDPNGQFESLAVGETASDTFTYTVSDGNGGTDTASVTVTITGANDPPAAVDDDKTVGEDSTGETVAVLANDTDPDTSDTLAVTAVDTTGTIGSVTNNGTDVTYDPNGQFQGLGDGETATDTFTYTVSDGNGGTDTATVTITISGANDPPTAVDDVKEVGQADPATTIDVLGNDTDPDGDTLSVDSVDTTGTLGTVTNNGTDVSYDPNGQFDLGPGETATDTFTYTVSDGNGGTDTATVTVTISGGNAPPVANDDAQDVSEDSTGDTVDVLANDTDANSDTLSVSGVDTTGTIGTVTNNGTDVTYDPNGQFEDLAPGETATDTFTYTVSDGTDTDTATVTITITGADDAPSAVADSFDAIGNTGLFVGTAKPAGQAGKEITGSILTNDTDIDSPHASLVAEPVTNAPTTLGGTITIASDGSFSYQPDDGDVGATDTFTYRVCDDTPCNSSTVSNATGTLSLPLTGQVWYVENDAAAGGDGTSDAPFDTLAEAEAASGTGDTTFVYDGDNTSVDLDTGYVMNTSERLIGEEQGLSLDPDGGGSLPNSPLYSAVGGARPTLTASNEDVVVLASGASIDGFNIDPSGTGGGIFGGAGTSGATIAHVHVDDTGTAGTQPGLELNGTTGTFSISDLEIDNGGSSTAVGVSLTNAGTVNFASAGTVSLNTSGAQAFSASATALGSSVFDDVTVTGSGTGGATLSNTTGSPTFTNLSLTTTSGSSAAFTANTAGLVTVPASGTANVSATGGPAVLVSGVTNGSELSFDQVTSSSSAGNGISLSGLGTSTFSAGSSSALSSATTADFSLDGGSGAVSYAGTITDTTGRLVNVQNTSGGTKAFSGAVTDSAGGSGTGVSLTSNTGATIRFTGGLNMSTGANAAYTATGGGTVGVTGSTNTIATTTGTALNVANTAISATDDLNFRSIAANGAANGIVLNNTGSGHLVVSGNGGSCTVATPTCTGGTLQNTTGDAISLTSTQGVSLTRMRIANNLGNGVKGTSVTGFALTDSVVDNNADDAATDEAGLNFTNLGGNASLVRDEVANSIEDNARIINTSATLSQLDVTDSTFRDTDAVSPGNNGLLLQSDGGSITADVLGSSFLRNRANGLQVVTNGSGSIDVDVNDSGTAQSVFDDNNIGVNIAHNGSGSLTYDVRNVSIDGLNAGGSASPININLGGSATTTMSGTVQGNTLTNHNSATGPGIRVIGNGTATLTTLIQSNTISGVGNFGIQVVARDGSNTVNATIKNNSITLTDPLSLDGIRVDSGVTATDTTKVCADIKTNTANTIAGQFGARVRQRFTLTTYTLAGYGGSPTDDTAVATFLNTNNTLSPAASADHAGAGFGTAVSCPQPAP